MPEPHQVHVPRATEAARQVLLSECILQVGAEAGPGDTRIYARQPGCDCPSPGQAGLGLRAPPRCGHHARELGCKSCPTYMLFQPQEGP